MSARRMGSMMAAVKRNALQAWPWWLGFALMWPVRYLPRTSLFFEAFPFFGAFQLLGCALAFLALLLAARPLWLLSDKAIRIGAFGVGVSAALGFVLIGDQANGALIPFGYLMIGMANAGFLALWYRAFNGMRAFDILVCLAFASVVLSLVDGVLLLLPDHVAKSLMVLLPLASPALLCRTLPLSLGNQLQERKAGKGTRRVKGEDAGYYVLAVVVGCAFGFMSRIVHQEPALTNDLLSVATLLAIAGALVVSAPAIEKRGFGPVLMRVALPVVAAAFLLLPIAPWPLAVTNTLCIMGAYYFYFAMFAFWSSESGMRGLAPFALFFLLQSVAEFVSSIVAARAFAALSQDYGNALFVVALVAVYVFFIVSNALAKREGGVPDVSHGEKAHREALQEAAAMFDLTEREREILVLVALGKPRKAIAAELFISEDTVKTHTRNLYKKLGVHSKKDVQALFDDGSPLKG